MIPESLSFEPALQNYWTFSGKHSYTVNMKQTFDITLLTYLKAGAASLNEIVHTSYQAASKSHENVRKCICLNIYICLMMCFQLLFQLRSLH